MGTRTCKDRVEAHKDSRMEDLKEFMNAPDIHSNYELEDGSNFYDYALSWDFVEPHTYEDQPIGYFRYQMSSGGPSEELRYYLNRSQTVVKSVKFWLLDWFDGASIELIGDDLDVAMWVAHMHHIEIELEDIKGGEMDDEPCNDPDCEVCCNMRESCNHEHGIN